MGVYAANGTRLSKTDFTATLTEDTADPVFTAGEEILTDAELYDGELAETGERTGRRVLVAQGGKISQSQIDALYAAPTITSITPNSGGAAGGDTVTIAGTDLDGTTAVNFGGTPGDNLDVVSPEEITVDTPAHAAGAVDVEVVDDAGSVTETDGFTYA